MRRIMASTWIFASMARRAIPVSDWALSALYVYLLMSNIRDVIPFPRTVKNCDL